LNLLVIQPLLESGFPEEIGCDELLTDASEESSPPRVIDIATAKPSQCFI
jgi:hypothetical protein